MAQFFVSTWQAAAQADRMKGIERELENCEKSIRSIGKSIDFGIASESGIRRRIGICADQTREAQEHMKCMRKALEEIMSCYEAAEHRICGHIGKTSVQKQSETRTTRAAEMYASIFKEYVGDKVWAYIKKIGSGKGWNEELVGWYEWLNKDLLGDFNSLKSWIEDIGEEYTFKKPELLPGGVSDFLSTINDCDILINVSKELKKYAETGDGWEAYEKIGSLIFAEVAKRGNKWMDKVDHLHYLGVDKKLQGVLLSTIIKMPSKWLDGIKEHAENGTLDAGTIVYDTVIGSFTESVASATEPAYKIATALTYPVIDQVCECLGFDLSGEYERLTGKKGLKAVFTAQKELWIDVVYAGVREKGSQAINGFYNAVGNGWKSWKSGMKLIMGR